MANDHDYEQEARQLLATALEKDRAPGTGEAFREEFVELDNVEQAAVSAVAKLLQHIDREGNADDDVIDVSKLIPLDEIAEPDRAAAELFRAHMHYSEGQELKRAWERLPETYKDGWRKRADGTTT